MKIEYEIYRRMGHYLSNKFLWYKKAKREKLYAFHHRGSLLNTISPSQNDQSSISGSNRVASRRESETSIKLSPPPKLKVKSIYEKNSDSKKQLILG